MKKLYDDRWDRRIAWTLIGLVVIIFWFFVYQGLKLYHAREFKKTKTELRTLKDDFKKLNTIKVTEDGRIFAIMEQVYPEGE